VLFNSYVFIFGFLPITVLGFFWIGEKIHHRLAVAWLVGASLFFYMWWNPAYLTLLILSILFNYAFGLVLSRANGGNTLHRKTLLTVGVTANLALLGYYKYANFFVDNINSIANTNFSIGTILLPLAISFFTFQQIAYLVDAYRGETREYNFLHYCLFVSFFPQLIAGPIVHHREMLPQFANDRIYRPQSLDIAIGITIFFIGLFKKVVIADTMALHATPIFDAAETGTDLSFFAAWEGALAYTFQLYFDFSGYSDMAIGLARIFGIILPANFASPYRATSIIDFWRRWHITLSRFLRDYLYFALGGNRKGRIRRYANLLVTMILGGLWHGAGWTFVAWGALHGSYLVVNHLWRKIFPWRIDRWWSRLSARSITFLCVVIGWVFFRAESFGGAITVLRGMANLPSMLDGKFGPLQGMLETVGFGFQGGYLAWEHYQVMGWFTFWLFIVWGWPNTQEWMRNYKPVFEALVGKNELASAKPRWPAWRPTARWGATTAVIASLGVLGLSSVTEFLYFQF
jgi:D-alanyl-lipoteichoic acid acyltransferase DltB (MBOAT superfamily)